MSNLVLTDQERTAFYQEITRNRALDYFFVFDNIPLQFVYRDKLIPGDMSDLEKRNQAITETLWLDAYHQYLVANVVYAYFYRGPILQMIFQSHQFGAGTFAPPAKEIRPFLATVKDVQASFNGWMDSKGWKMADDLRQQPPRASWASLLGVPDRTVRIASIIPVGNQVILELISTWTEDDKLKEAAWVAVLIYDTDGTVLQDRSYIDLVNWPSARRYSQPSSGIPQSPLKIVGAGVMDRFYEYHRSLQISTIVTDLEKRNLAIINGAWVDSYNNDFSADVFHPERFRMQWPVQKCSCNFKIASEIEAIIKEVAPDRKMRLGLTYAKGNQVGVEGVVTWQEKGINRESPFISFLVLDNEGKVIRERRYVTLSNWPAAEKITARLGL
jgi:hypothetical protein